METPPLVRVTYMYKEYVGKIKDEHYEEPYGIHGVRHIKRVLYLAEKISAHYDLTEKEKKILALSVCYHDIGRWHNDVDPDHGKLSAIKMAELGLLDGEELDFIEKELIHHLIVCHCLGDDSFKGTPREKLLFQIVKDADGLDRVRIFDLDPCYLRLRESRELVDFAWMLFLNRNWEQQMMEKENHICKYCGGIAKGDCEDLLCDDCRMLFGHTLYSEL